MKARPILFSGAMVRALLEGRKTQTRRVIKNIETLPNGLITPTAGHVPRSAQNHVPYCPYGKPGDLLYVKETYGIGYDDGEGGYSAIPWTGSNPERDGKAFYKADYPAEQYSRPWKSSRYMPRSTSRITLKLTDVRVERVQDISAEDIISEGAVDGPHDGPFGHNPVSAFDGRVYLDLQSLWAKGWDSINGKKHPWCSNPLVWALTFEVIQQNVDQVLERAA